MKSLVESLFDSNIITKTINTYITDLKLVKSLIIDKLSNEFKCKVYKRSPDLNSISQNLFMYEKDSKWGDYRYHSVFACFKLEDNPDNWAELKITFSRDDNDAYFIQRIALGTCGKEIIVLYTPGKIKGVEKYKSVSKLPADGRLKSTNINKVYDCIKDLINKTQSFLENKENMDVFTSNDVSFLKQVSILGKYFNK